MLRSEFEAFGLQEAAPELGGRFSSSGSTEVPGTNLKVSTSVSDTKVRLGGGAGLRYYVSENWGIRPELRVDRYFGDQGSTAFRYTVGVFYQFGK